MITVYFNLIGAKRCPQQRRKTRLVNRWKSSSEQPHMMTWRTADAVSGAQSSAGSNRIGNRFEGTLESLASAKRPVGSGRNGKPDREGTGSGTARWKDQLPESRSCRLTGPTRQLCRGRSFPPQKPQGVWRMKDRKRRDGSPRAPRPDDPGPMRRASRCGCTFVRKHTAATQRGCSWKHHRGRHQSDRWHHGQLPRAARPDGEDVRTGWGMAPSRIGQDGEPGPAAMPAPFSWAWAFAAGSGATRHGRR